MKKWQKYATNLFELGELLPEIFVSYSFLDGLDSSYNAWKDIFFLSYIKAMMDKNGKIVQLIVEEILKILIDRQAGQDNGVGSSKSQLKEFKAQ